MRDIQWEEEISIDKDDYTINARIFIVTSLIRDIPSRAFLPLTAVLEGHRDLHNERSRVANWQALTGRPISSSTCWSQVLCRQPNGQKVACTSTWRRLARFLTCRKPWNDWCGVRGPAWLSQSYAKPGRVLFQHLPGYEIADCVKLSGCSKKCAQCFRHTE